jgi:hypothetical protein
MSNTYLHKELRKFKMGVIDGSQLSDSANNHFTRHNKHVYSKKKRQVQIKKNHEKSKRNSRNITNSILE